MTSIIRHAISASNGESPRPMFDQWRTDRLHEARSILADTTRHPETLVILAARVIADQMDDASECADTVDLFRQLDQTPLPVLAAVALPNGGAA